MDSYLNKCSFPDSGKEIDCAVSGGADSVAMMILAKMNGCNVRVHYVDHNIRSTNEAEFVANLARRFELEFKSYQINIEPGSNLEARARTKRFEVLPKGVATAHTMDDQVETFFINLLRGSSLSGLSGMTRSFSHPILNMRRAETVEIVNHFGITPFEDPSNSDLHFVRNKIRHLLIPLLNDISNRDIVPIIFRQMELMRDDDDLLQSYSSRLNPLNVTELRNSPKPLASRALRNLLTNDDGYMPSRSDIEKIFDVVNLRHEAAQIKDGVMVRRSKGILKVER